MAASGERQRLENGLAGLRIEATTGQRDQLLAYLAELRRWNASYNLVAAGEMPHLVTRHLLDSVTINPGWRFTLLDSAGKKVRFLNHVVRTLGLANVTPVHERVENFSAAGEFSTIVSRAFAAVRPFLEATRHLAGPETRWLAMLGRRPASANGEWPAWARVVETARLEVPGLDAERHVAALAPLAE